ncbi:type III secretion system protein [Erwinia amylovora]|uniref:Bacterial type III secretion apparatus protein OrgAa n=3 Tax=Erwinia amylovora TaxID=552 RepID=A0A830ZX84_ERWAM|nr:type III secretion system protein [Erwinia amylovora]CDK14352.1 Bacterial type III secretion apparatus protein OrgAa [Erwinia amylovora LA635]CDK17719.1 Bacterial type III secretion apparatus protein OrgAa [Erwinia amylovora LA636]CDK21088.1 Bacterial type III secretion apparatus protein OrgAa [Erwinia amylovora LA637]ATZ12437.1 type III secretion system protein [Erwinia amylovora]EKV55054.1 Bacterial type III secretion apparatus protein OrgAa [Erwinia amylovora ACW56400]
MKHDAEHVMQIMYYPSDYTDPSHLPDSLAQGEVFNDVLINYWLLSHFQLDNENKYWQPTDINSSLIVAHWHQLPRIAHLLGGYLLRNRLPGYGAALICDPQLLAFISLPLIHHVTIDEAERRVDTLAWGAAFILSMASSLLPALKQRILLGFPAGIDLPELHVKATPNHINLFKMAITYANNYQ